MASVLAACAPLPWLAALQAAWAQGRSVDIGVELGTQRLLEGLHVGGSLEAGRMDHPLVPGSPTGLLKSASLFIGADTPFGPLYLGYGRDADGNQSAYLYLGRP